MSSLVLCAVLVVALLAVIMQQSMAMPPIGVVANVRGKKYEITAETVQDFSTEVENLTGIPADQQSVLFRGKVLTSTDRLEELGIAPGEVLNVVKGRKARISRPEDAVAGSEGSAQGDLSGMDADLAGMKDVNPEQVEKAMKQMDKLLDSNFIEEYFGDEERLEKSRLEMLSNMDKYEEMMPGFKKQAESIASDPVKWKEAMNKAKEQMLQLKQQRDAMKAAQGNLPRVEKSDSVDDIADEDDSN